MRPLAGMLALVLMVASVFAAGAQPTNLPSPAPIGVETSIVKIFSTTHSHVFAPLFS